MGGALLQKLHRDTSKYAFKCSNITRNGEDFHVYKDPVDAPDKASKRGRLKLVYERGDYRTEWLYASGDPDQLVEVFRNGEIRTNYEFDSIRKLSLA